MKLPFHALLVTAGVVTLAHAAPINLSTGSVTPLSAREEAEQHNWPASLGRRDDDFSTVLQVRGAKGVRGSGDMFRRLREIYDDVGEEKSVDDVLQLANENPAPMSGKLTSGEMSHIRNYHLKLERNSFTGRLRYYLSKNDYDEFITERSALRKSTKPEAAEHVKRLEQDALKRANELKDSKSEKATRVLRHKAARASKGDDGAKRQIALETATPIESQGNVDMLLRWKGIQKDGISTASTGATATHPSQYKVASSSRSSKMKRPLEDASPSQEPVTEAIPSQEPMTKKFRLFGVDLQ